MVDILLAAPHEPVLNVLIWLGLCWEVSSVQAHIEVHAPSDSSLVNTRSCSRGYKVQPIQERNQWNDSPGSRVVKTLHSSAEGCEFDPWSGS